MAENELFQDANFQVLAAQKTGAEDFLKLVEKNLPGYTQKKRLADGLKEFTTKIEAIEQKLYMVKAVGKVKGKMETEDHAMIEKYSTIDLKEKLQSINANIQSMIDGGQLTLEERPVLQDQLAARRANAKAAEKTKLVEKLELMLVSVSKAVGIVHAIPNLEDFYPLEQELQYVQRLEKKTEKSRTDEDRAEIKKKPEILDSMKKLEPKGRMWFEADEEFKQRLDKALVQLAKQKAEQKKRQEEEAIERKRREEEEALERKRQAVKEAEEKKAKELADKLEQKRLEASLKPQKAAPAPKKKEKPKAKRMNPLELFKPPPRPDSEDEAAEGAEADHAAEALVTEHVQRKESAASDAQTADGADAEDAEDVADAADAEDVAKAADAEDVAPPSTPPNEPSAPAEATPTKEVSPVKAEDPVPAVAPTKPKSQAKAWGAAPAPEADLEVDGDAPSLAEAVGLAGPSLTDAAGKATVKKMPPPQPKKKEKKKFAKVSAFELGFDAANPNAPVLN